MKNRSFGFLAARDGAIAVIFAIGLSVVAGIWALSIDLGRAWNLETQLQNAADAAALACASQLDQETGALARARLAAMGGLVQNTQSFAQDGAGANVTITANDIVFYSDIAAKTVTTADANATYCEVTASPRSVNVIFAALISNVSTISPRARAVAELATAHCRIPPILICNPDAPNPFDPVAHRGKGITLKNQGGGGLAPGNFGLLALPSQAKAILSTNDIRDAWGRVRPMAECFGGTVTTKPGQATAIRQGLNMRFDIFFQGTHQVPSGEDPVKINPNYTPALNNVKGLTPGIQCSYQHPQGWNKTADHKYNKENETILPTSPIAAMGFPRDECAYGPAGACNVNVGGTHIGDGNWAYDTYMQINHPTMAAPATPVPPIPDLDGVTGGNPTRHEVYSWELDNLLSEAPPENAPPMCHTNPWSPQLNRRVISAAVVDCSKLTGTTTIKPEAWVDLFLTEPMGVYDGANDLYAEIMGPSDQGLSTVVWYLLRLVE